MTTRDNTLTIVIPALNEEASIGDTLQRCLDAREHILANSQVEDVEIIVVSDGSTDRTAEIARRYPDTTVLVFDQNRGYGAAIKCGFEHGHGDLLGFLDADGTCDPLMFAPLCQAIQRDNADVAIGSRMGPESEMPLVRRAGNKLFAWMLGLLSSQVVRDTASGMRVLKRSRLGALYPLPDGLHFTPAMSARVLLGADLKIVELPMSYAERVGRSKLSPGRDGVRFLRIIVQTALCYRPGRLLVLLSCLLGLGSLVVALGPLLSWLTEGRVQEWMVYRVLLASLLAMATALAACAAAVAEQMSIVAFNREDGASGIIGIMDKRFVRRLLTVGMVLLLATAVVVAWPGIFQFTTTGHTDMHWSRAVLAALLVMLAAVVLMTSFLLSMLELIQDRRADPCLIHPPDARHEAWSSAS